MKNFEKIATVILILNFFIQSGDNPVYYSYEIKIPVVNKARSYEFYVSLNGSRMLNEMQFLGFENRSETIPAIITHDSKGNEKLKMVAIAFKAEDGQEKRIATQIFYYKAPKGTFKKITEIGIDFSKVLSLNERGKFKVSFKPNNLPIQ